MQSTELTERKRVTSGTKEWADHNVNCLKGCYNDCRYCYAKMMAKRFRWSTYRTWKSMTIRGDVVKRNYEKLSGRVMFPSSHDIFDFPRVREACFTVMAKLLKSGNDLLLTTKPRFSVIREIDRLFSQHKEQLQFRFTITSNDDRLLAFWEPNAPPFRERMNALKFAFDRNYRTSVSIEPFLDYYPQVLVETVAPYSSESIWIGKMNYIPRYNIDDDDSPWYDAVRKNYEINHLKNIYDGLKDFPKIRFKDSIRITLGL